MSRTVDLVDLDVPLPPGLRWQRLTIADHQQVCALHLASLEGIAASVVRREEPDFFAATLLGRGELAGVFHGPDMIAYTVLLRTMAVYDDPSPEWTPDPSMPLVKLAGSGVLQAWRGLGLQKAFIAQRVRMAGPQAQVFGTASPANQASWRNLLSGGFTLRAIKHMYGGSPRFIGVRLPHQPPAGGAEPSATDVELDCFDTEGQQHLMRQGWQGVAVGAGPNRIRYRRVQPPEATP
ncbi:MAG: hypothetical protein Q8S32_02220 [Burkholderiaceae bacterium]|nr:hypothetical protein [Burkholderiaceae bacterium]